MFSFNNPLKAPENLWLSGVFMEYKIGTLASNGCNVRNEIYMNQFYLRGECFVKVWERLHEDSCEAKHRKGLAK